MFGQTLFTIKCEIAIIKIYFLTYFYVDENMLKWIKMNFEYNFRGDLSHCLSDFLIRRSKGAVEISKLIILNVLYISNNISAINLLENWSN